MSYVDRIIEAFGGIRPMATTIGKQPSTVQSWKVRGSIPDEHKSLIWDRAREVGITLKPEHFVPFDARPTPSEAGETSEDAA